MKQLNPLYYRTNAKYLEAYHLEAPITIANVEARLDAGMIEAAVSNGKATKWWRIKRSGKTQRWKRSPERIRIPFKCGFRYYGAFSEEDFS